MRASKRLRAPVPDGRRNLKILSAGEQHLHARRVTPARIILRSWPSSAPFGQGSESGLTAKFSEDCSERVGASTGLFAPELDEAVVADGTVDGEIS